MVRFELEKIEKMDKEWLLNLNQLGHQILRKFKLNTNFIKNYKERRGFRKSITLAYFARITF